MATRLPPKAMAKKLVRALRTQHPDYHYLKKVFQHTRTLLAIQATPPAKRLPVLLTDVELVAFYNAIWQARQLTHAVMLKLLLFTGMRNAELVHLRPTDIDLQTCQVRITQGKGRKDRSVLFPTSFRGNSPNTWNARSSTGQRISSNPIAANPTRPGAYARLSNSTPRPRGLRNGSIPISFGTSSLPI